MATDDDFARHQPRGKKGARNKDKDSDGRGSDGRPDASDHVADRASLRLDPLVSAAWLYYHFELTQAEIAELLGISRTSVVNLLAQARERGVVSVRLEPTALSRMELALELRRTFGLHDALIVPAPPDLAAADEAALRAVVGRAAAQYLEKILAPGDTLAVGWGVTMLAMAQALGHHPVEEITVAQLTGGFSTAAAFSPSKVAATVADKLGARFFHLYTPAFVASPEIRDILLRDPAIASALEVAKGASKAIVGVGRADRDDTMVKAGFLSAVQMEELRLRGAVGNLISRYYDITGRAVESSLNDRLTSLGLEDLRAIPLVIGMGVGSSRLKALLGALRGRYLDVLITDEHTARALLELADREGGPRPAFPGQTEADAD